MVKTSQKQQPPQRSTLSSLGPHSLDILGSKFSLRFPTLTGKFQTAFGGYLSIIMALFSGAAFMVIFSQFFDTDTPVVTSSLEFGEKVIEQNMFSQDIFTPIAIHAEENLPPAALVNKYFTIKIKLTVFERDPQTGRSGIRIKRTIDYVSCASIKDPEIVEKFLRVLPSKEHLFLSICPDFRGIKDEFLVKVDPVNFSFHEVIMHIYPCSLPDSTQCASKAQVNQAVLILYRLDKFVVSTDKEDPLRVNFDRNSIMMDTFNSKYRYMDVQKNLVIDDTSIFGNPYTKLEYATASMASMDTRSRDPTNLHCTKEQVENDLYEGCAPYLMVNYRAVSYMMVVRRTYKKLTTIMGEFGGVLKLMTTGVMLFYSFYNSRKMKAFFVKKIFNISAKNSKDLKELMEKDDLRRKEEMKNEAGGASVGGQNLAKNQGKGDGKGVKDTSSVRSMKEVMKICVEGKLSATEILSKLSFVDVLQETLFNEDERTLLPLAILRMKERELRRSEMAQKATENQKEKKGEQAGIERIFKREERAQLNKKAFKVKTGVRHGVEVEKESENIYERAYRRLLSSHYKPKPFRFGEDQNLGGNGEKVSISEFILENVQDFFEQPRDEGDSEKGHLGAEIEKNGSEKRSNLKPNLKGLQMGEKQPGSKKSIKSNKIVPKKKFSTMTDTTTNNNPASSSLQSRGDMSPLKIDLKRGNFKASPARPIGSPLRRKVTKKKSHLTFKLDTALLNNQSEQNSQNHQNEQN